MTASKSLQDQYTGDFDFLRPMKGKGNFACLQQMDREDLRDIPYPAALKKGLTCDKGKCSQKVTENGQQIDQNCKYKPSILDYEAKTVTEKICPYYEQKYSALLAKSSVWNYSAYFQVLKYNKKTYGKYLKKNIAIFDEAHKMEDQILQFVGIDITSNQISECKLDIDDYELSEVEMLITLLDDMASKYSMQLEEIENSPTYTESDNERLDILTRKYERTAQQRVDLHTDKENYVINDPKKIDSKFHSVSLAPLDISKYVKEFMITPYQLFMSATINKDSFCETTGIEPDEVAFVDAPYSPFPAENRKIEFMEVGRINYNTPRDVEAKLYGTINEILSTLHPDEKGLILTSSRSWCSRIYQNLTASNQSRVQQCHSTGNENGMTQNEVLEMHASSYNGVLLSSSLWEGVDLKDDLSRFQIIAKAPYPVLTEKRVVKKKEKHPLWYRSQTLTKLLQGFGRSIRNEDDKAVTYVLDSSVKSLLYTTKNMVPKSYHDVLSVTN